jgi:DNA polymerase-1|tara:strand:+ start:5426 stop:6439 length:1014 start_codon:yes stop_codon:yes gene_type:complete
LKTKTLIVDGNSLLKLGFHGVKSLFVKDKHIGGLFHFLNTLRKYIVEESFNKVVVFWDGKNNNAQRREIYKEYKSNRRNRFKDQDAENSFNYQKVRTQEYLEELFVRQGIFEKCEADDCIAYYSQITPNEEKTILTADKDLTQLISPTVKVILTSTGKVYSEGDLIKMKDVSIPSFNIPLYKIICGDSSDNIPGVKLVGGKTLMNSFPEIKNKKVEIEEILDLTSKLLEKNNNFRLNNIKKGVTRNGELGSTLYDINKKLVDLSTPLLTETAINNIKLISEETIDPTDRGWKNIIKMMMDDGMFEVFPSNDDAWIQFIQPFLNIIKVETKKFKKNEK